MARRPLAAVILAAGQGTRMKSDRPKVAFEVCGWPMVRHVVEAARAVRAERIVVVVGHGRAQVEKALADVPNVEFATQREQKGTADAVKAGLRPLKGFEGTVVVLCGDVPLVRQATLKTLLQRHRRRKVAASILSVTLDDARSYGRILRDAKGAFVAIREARDCTDEEHAVREINTGLMAFESGHLRSALRAVRTNNSQGEYYLTDVPSILLKRGERVQAVDCGTDDEVLGVNTMAELAEAGSRMRWRILGELMASGVEIVDPASTFVDRAARIGRGTRILPCSVIERDVVVGRHCEVGPFTHLRPGTVMKDRAEVGNFVETKKAVVGAGAKAKHLTYLGDAEIGAGSNIGCGTITANYDGKNKHRTVVEEDVHIGSGTVLVAPVRVGRGATTGAGAIVTAGQDVAPGDVVVGVPARSLRKGKGEQEPPRAAKRTSKGGKR
jgi:bifunctional UDP-N-acetylglucosamine pyrophosphorylase/glucosamine-1-phosphate N-acetyltransferase